MTDQHMLEYLALVRTVLNAVIEGTKERASHEADTDYLVELERRVFQQSLLLQRSSSYLKTDSPPCWHIMFDVMPAYNMFVGQAALPALHVVEQIVNHLSRSEELVDTPGADLWAGYAVEALETLAEGRNSVEITGAISPASKWYLRMRALAVGDSDQQ